MTINALKKQLLSEIEKEKEAALWASKMGSHSLYRIHRERGEAFRYVILLIDDKAIRSSDLK